MIPFTYQSREGKKRQKTTNVGRGTDLMVIAGSQSGGRGQPETAMRELAVKERVCISTIMIVIHRTVHISQNMFNCTLGRGELYCVQDIP